MTSRRSMMLPAAIGSVLLTMTALGQVFTQQRWLVPSFFAVLVAFGTGWAARRLDVPGILSPALSMLAMLTVLGIVFLPDTTAAGIPTAATMEAIGDALAAAVSDIKSLAPPANPTDALTLLATAGVFLVATIVDLMVFRLRRPVAAGMPLLALFLIPTSMAKHTNVFAFVVAAVGYLGILVAEGRDRARAWGRRLSGVERADEFADVSHVARVGRRIGSAAVGIALCVPVVLPSVGDGMFEGTNGNDIFGRGRGNQTAFVLNPIVEIRTRLQTDEVRSLFTVETNSPQYLRLTSLDVFDGDEWTLKRRDVGSDHRVSGGDEDDLVPTPEELDGITLNPLEYTVTIGDDLAVNWLPLAYVPRRVDVPKGEDWRYEGVNLSVFTTQRTSQNITYRAESLVPTFTPEQLKAPGEIPKRIREEYLALPEGRRPPPSAVEIVQRETAGKATAYDKAAALNAFFFSSGQFEYTLNVPPGNDTDALAAFLDRRTGYCEQFAAAMAYLARMAGIPSRVVVGFSPGSFARGRWVVTNKDAHAWPELYFPRTGWVRFEPTPRPGTQAPDWVYPDGPPQPDPSGDPTPPTAAPEPTETPVPDPRGRQEAMEDVITPAAPDAGGTGGDSGLPVVPLAGLALAGALATPSAVGWAGRRRRRRRATDPLGRIHAAWDTLADAAEDTGHRLRASDSPRGAARRLVASASLSGPVADEVLRLAAAEERARYAPSAPAVDGLDTAAKLVRRTLFAGLPGRSRVRALVFPASSLRRMANGWRAASEKVERTQSALRNRLLALLPWRRRARTA